MTKKWIAALALLVGFSWIAWSWQSSAQDARSVLASAAKALGSENLKSLEYSGSGYDFTLGQAPNPSSPWPKFNDETYSRQISFEPPASRMRRVRTQAENPPRGGGQQPIIGEQQQDQVVAPGSPQAATLMDDVMMSVPYGFLRAAAATSEKPGDGVYLILGGYAALAVDMTDHIVIVEGPQSDERADAVIAEAKRLIPNKPIRYVVNTHSHFDHAGGLRAFVSEGATAITQEINKPNYEKIWANPHTLSPDKLARNPKKPSFKTVGEKMVLSDGTHTIELYHMTNFLHHDGMLLAYLPKEKVLLEADAFNPPAQPVTQTPGTISPYNQSLAANIERLKLDVQRIVPVHLPADNRKVTMTELMKAIGKG